MLRRSVGLAGLALCGLLWAAAPARADDDDDHSGRTVRRVAVAIQTITVPDGSPLLAFLPPELLPGFELVAVGGLVFDFEPGGTAFVGQAAFVGDFPFDFVLASDKFFGTLTRVRRGFEFETDAPFELTTELPIGPGGAFVTVELFTLEDATFTATLRGRGFPPGTTFVSPESVALGLKIGDEVFEDLDGNPVPVAFSSDRTVEIVKPPRGR